MKFEQWPNKACLTYRSQSIHLSGASAPDILRDTIKVKNKSRECFSIMSLPLSNRIKGLCGRLLVPNRLSSGLSLLFSCSIQFPLERAGLGIIRPTSKDLRIPRLMMSRGSCPRRRTYILLHTINYLFLRGRLSVRNFELSAGGPRPFGRDRTTHPERGIGGIRDVCERRSTSGHIEGGLR